MLENEWQMALYSQYLLGGEVEWADGQDRLAVKKLS